MFRPESNFSPLTGNNKTKLIDLFVVSHAVIAFIFASAMLIYPSFFQLFVVNSAEFTEVASDKMDAYMEADQSMMSNFTQSAFQNADEGDAEMIADMMQQTSGKNSAYLMSSMMENNNTMISSVYGNLADQDFDIFNHIEKAKMYPTTPETDPLLPTPGTDPFPTPGTDPASMMTSQANFYDDLKGQINRLQ